MQLFLCAGDSAPRPPGLKRLGVLPPDSQPLKAGDFYPRPPKQPHHCEFLATRPVFLLLLRYAILCKLILRLAGVYGFPQAALSLNKFAHLWDRASATETVHLGATAGRIKPKTKKIE